MPSSFCKPGGKVAGIAKAYLLCDLADAVVGEDKQFLCLRNADVDQIVIRCRAHIPPEQAQKIAFAHVRLCQQVRKAKLLDVDLVILQLLTYATSYNMLPTVRDLNVPVVLVNVQKKKAPDYANTDTPTWLGELYACGAVGEMVTDLERAGKRHAVITGVVEGGGIIRQTITDDLRAIARDFGVTLNEKFLN